MALERDRGTQTTNDKRQATTPMPMPMPDSILVRHGRGKQRIRPASTDAPVLSLSAPPICSPTRPPHILSPVALQPTGSGLASQEKLVMHTTKSLTAHPRPVPCHSVPHPPTLESSPTPKGPNPPFIPSVQRDLHQVSLTAPQLGPSRPSLSHRPSHPRATRRAAVCSPETCLYLRLLGGAAYYFHPLLRGI
ncbi:hypothetical protein BDP55DRAFT_211567 [Colletotrichum godetiae]|uniref:Uncharacterized protein n=1 Tax=Colletotrichum godetiae TaxID=1209918 RepID=A0AAJ0AX83_9PEZI|nr:uncharacterized protein BDP55DRAFT_211567 [Colletotrichum godetiae]KAK1699918.1 hypothetical protein BDP55DRAFT_211567 [Colletotrichum godetiae]